MVTDKAPQPLDVGGSPTRVEDQLARDILERVARKWPMAVMRVLAHGNGPLRFSRVLERVEGISQKVLTQTLRSLEQDGLVTRTLYPQVPPRVEYELTPLGGDLLLQLLSLWRWIAAKAADFGSARDAN
jgi:DNA-binding HxlR family transcriptional regulator